MVFHSIGIVMPTQVEISFPVACPNNTDASKPAINGFLILPTKEAELHVLGPSQEWIDFINVNAAILLAEKLKFSPWPIGRSYRLRHTLSDAIHHSQKIFPPPPCMLCS